MMPNTPTPQPRRRSSIATPTLTRDPITNMEQAHAWLAGQFDRARSNGRMAIWALLTPQLAEAIIERNMPAGSNRTLRPNHVLTLANIIRSGAWSGDTHQGIAFSVDGVLNDGQHRIHAVHMTKIAVEVMMTFGQQRETFKVVDQDLRARSGGDLVSIAVPALPGANYAASVARMILTVGTPNWMEARRTITRADVLEFAEAYEGELARAMRDGRQAARGLMAKVSPSSMAAAFFLIRQTSKAAAVDDFVSRLETGADLERTNPLLILREGLRARSFGREYRQKEEARPFEVCAVLKAWTLWRTGRTASTVRVLRVGRNELPKIAP